MQDKVLVHPSGEKRIIHMEGNTVFIYDGEDVELGCNPWRSEMTAHSHVRTILLHLADEGYKPLNP